MTVTGPHLDSPLVSTQWLADHLGAEKLVILDATVVQYPRTNGKPGYLSGHDQYLFDGHLPGTYFADLTEVFSDARGEYPFTRPGIRQFEDAAGSVGVGNDTTVVVYDAILGQWASRIWWLFRAFGYDRVAVLNGGIAKWRAEGRRVESGHVEPTRSEFSAIERPELWADKAEVERIAAGRQAASLVCATPARDFAGEESPRARAGHIPGSVSVPLSRIIDPLSRVLAPVEQLRTQFEPVLDSGRIVLYCAGGIAAAADALALTLLGERNLAIYDGSLNEWVADPSAELVTGR